MSNLQRTQIVDANGHVTHRNKRVDSTPTDTPPRYAHLLPPTDSRSTAAKTDIPLSSDDVATALSEISDLVSQGVNYYDALHRTAASNGERGITALLGYEESKLFGNDLATALSARADNIAELPVELEAQFGSQWKPVLDAIMRFGSIDTKGASDMLRGHKIRGNIIKDRDMWRKVRANTDLGTKADAAAFAMRVAHPDNNNIYGDSTATRIADSAVRAMVLKDAIGTNGITQEYYDRETSHLIRGIGDLLPSD